MKNKLLYGLAYAMLLSESDNDKHHYLDDEKPKRKKSKKSKYKKSVKNRKKSKAARKARKR